MDKKIVSLDLEAAREKAKEAALGAATKIRDAARAKKEQVVAGALAKSIELSKKQLEALEQVAKKRK